MVGIEESGSWDRFSFFGGDGGYAVVKSFSRPLLKALAFAVAGFWVK